MNSNVFIITGTSKGIGEQLAKMLLRDGNYVYGISRGSSEILQQHMNYMHFNFDLNDFRGLEGLMDNVFDQLRELSNPDMICLINNAAMLDPLKPIDQCNAEEIRMNIQISLIAPMILTSSFIRRTNSTLARRKIINISSGSGTYPAPGMSVYCTAKAGMNMFTQCVGAEQTNRNNPVEIIAVDPGMVDTELQMMAREQDDQEFEMAKRFRQVHQSGQLISKEVLGNHLLKIIDRQISPGMIIKYSDMLFDELSSS